jgi:hypothetical protein
MHETARPLIEDMEAASVVLRLSPSTIGERAGQGGRFYARLKSGARVWPETAAQVRAWINQASKNASDPAPVSDVQKVGNT